MCDVFVVFVLLDVTIVYCCCPMRSDDCDVVVEQEEALRNVIKASLASQLQQDLKKKQEEAKELEKEVDEEI